MTVILNNIFNSDLNMIQLIIHLINIKRKMCLVHTFYSLCKWEKKNIITLSEIKIWEIVEQF